MRVHFHKQFTKRLQKQTEKEQKLTKKGLKLFLLSPHHPSLRNHPLKGNYFGYRSIDIRPDLRAIFKQLDDIVIFVELGNHNSLFK